MTYQTGTRAPQSERAQLVTRDHCRGEGVEL